MLSSDQILERLSPDGAQEQRICLIPEPCSKEIRSRAATSIDLRLGRWFRSFKQDQSKSFSLIGTDQEQEIPTREHFVSFGSPFILHPGRFVLGATLEWLRLPRDLSGYVSGKSSLGRHGLVIETAAGVHPGFSGCLTLELANVGEVPLDIYPGMKICQIFLHNTKPSVSEDIGTFSGSRKPNVFSLKSDSIFEKLRNQS